MSFSGVAICPDPRPGPGPGLVVVRHVPALIRDHCGEEWLDDAVAEALEGTAAEARAKHRLVEVTEWRDLAA